MAIGVTTCTWMSTGTCSSTRSFMPYKLMDRERPWDRNRTNRIYRRVAGATPREEATISVERIASLMRKHESTNRFTLIGRKLPGGTIWEVWKARAFDGHSIQELRAMSLPVPIIPAHANIIPCIAHGTRAGVLSSTLSIGLRTMGRQCVMFSAFPHWGARIGHGQRSGQGQWSAVVFLSKTRALHRNKNDHSRPLPIGIAGSSGTMSAHADILPQ